MMREDQIDSILRVASKGGELPADFGEVSPVEAELQVIEVLFAVAARLRAHRSEYHRYLSLSPPERVAWQFAHPGGLDFPSPEQIQEAESRAEAALAQYIAKWSDGWPMPAGFMRCDGHRPGGGIGPHLRKALKSDKGLEIAGHTPTTMHLFEPGLGPGERAAFTIGSPTPIIAQGPIEAPEEESADLASFGRGPRKH
jgi:hypothetical protein